MKNKVLNGCLILASLTMCYMIAAFSSDVIEYNRLLSVQWCKKSSDGVYYPPDSTASWYGVYVYAQKNDTGHITVNVKTADNRRSDAWVVYRISGSKKIATAPDMDSAMKKWGSITCTDDGSYIGESQLYVPYFFRN